MIFKSLTYLATTAALTVGGYAVLTQVYPEGASAISGLVYDKVLGWNELACQSNPLGCLQNRYTKLQTLESSVDRSLSAIQSQKGRISAMVEEQETIVAKNSAFLNEGKAIFKNRIGKADTPVDFAGKTYPNTGIFKQQLGLLFQEKNTLEKSLGDAKALEKKLQDRLENLMVQAGNITMAKRMIPAQVELVRANNALADFDGNMEMINGVIKGSEVGLDESDQLIRTTKDLMEPDPVTPSTTGPISDKAFDSFLAQ